MLYIIATLYIHTEYIYTKCIYAKYIYNSDINRIHNSDSVKALVIAQGNRGRV